MLVKLTPVMAHMFSWLSEFFLTLNGPHTPTVCKCKYVLKLCVPIFKALISDSSVYSYLSLFYTTRGQHLF